MRKTVLSVICASVLGLCSVDDANGQMMPNYSAAMNQMIQQNMAFDAQMHQAAINAANQFFQDRMRYRMQTGDWGYLPGPVSAGQLSQSIAEMTDAFDDYNVGMMENSARQDAAVGRWITGAVRDEWYYQNPETGHMQTLPHYWDTYNVQNGEIYPGYIQGGDNMYPVYPGPYAY